MWRPRTATGATSLMFARPQTTTAFRFGAGAAYQNAFFLPASSMMTAFHPIAKYSTRQSEDDVNVKPVAADIIRKARYRSIVDGLEKDSRVKMPFSEFISLCKANGIDEDEANKLAEALHDSGRFLHYSTSPQLRDVILLKPDELAVAFAKLLDVKGDFSKQFVATKKEELDKLSAEIAVLENKRDELNLKAHKRADRILTLGAIILAFQGFAVARLTWWELSWDIMEPVTYMLTFSAVLGGYLYFKLTRTDYTYEALRERLAKKRLQKLLTKEGFNPNRLSDLKSQADSLQAQINAPEKYLLHGFPQH